MSHFGYIGHHLIVAIIDYIPNGWVMWKMGTWLMTHVKRHETTNQSNQKSSADDDRGLPSSSWIVTDSTRQIQSELLVRKPPKNKNEMGVSENRLVPLNPMVLLIIIPIKWLFHWGYTLFSDIPKCSRKRFPQLSGFPKISHWGKEHHRLSNSRVCPTAAPQTAASPATLCASEARRSAHLNWPIWASSPQKNYLSSVVRSGRETMVLKCVEHLQPPSVLVVDGTIFSRQVELLVLVEFRRLFQDVFTHCPFHTWESPTA